MLSVSTGFTCFQVATFSQGESVGLRSAPLCAPAATPRIINPTITAIFFHIDLSDNGDHPNRLGRMMPNRKLFPADKRPSSLLRFLDSESPTGAFIAMS